DAILLAAVTKGRRVDLEPTRELVEIARPLPLTYPRAFAQAIDPQALEDVIETGAKRILTSGGANSALEGDAVLSELIEAARERIAIVPGAGISAANIAEVARRTKAREFHSGLSAALPNGSTEYKGFEEEVRKLADQLARIRGPENASERKADL